MRRIFLKHIKYLTGLDRILYSAGTEGKWTITPIIIQFKFIIYLVQKANQNIEIMHFTDYNQILHLETRKKFKTAASIFSLLIISGGFTGFLESIIHVFANRYL